MKKIITTVSPIFPPEIGGPATYIEKLITFLPNTQVIAFCTQIKPKLDQKNITLIPTSHNILFRQGRLLIALLYKASRKSTLYSQGTLVVGVASLIASKILGIKLVVKFVGDEIWEEKTNKQRTKSTLEEFYKQPQNSLKLWLHREVLQKADKIIVPSIYLKEFLVHYHQVSESKIAVISNAVNSLKKPSEKQFGKIVFVGRLVKWKNVDMIVKAFAIAYKCNHKLRLEIIGDGPERKTIERMITRLKLNTSVSVLGIQSRKEVLKTISAAEKLVLFSSYEGQPHTLIEAMIAKTQIVCSDIPANKEMVKNFATIVSINNVQALSEAMLKKNERKKLVLAKKYALKKFSWRTHVAKLKKLFNSL